MGILKNILEPATIAAILILGAWINRRPVRHNGTDDYLRAPLLPKNSSTEEQDSHGESGEGIETFEAPRRRSRLNIQSRMLVRYPFLLEIWYWLLIYWMYQGARATTARVIADKKHVMQMAEHHTIQLLSFEHRLHIDIELSIQRFILTHAPGLMDILAIIYYSHIVVSAAFYVYCYTYLPRPRYQAIRRALALMNVFAFAIMSLWRCKPPRLLPDDLGFVDVLHSEHSGSAWTHNKFQLTIAAMPSLHFGNSVFIAFCVGMYSPHVLLRVIAPLWPVMMGWTVIATANHFVLDMVVGVVVVMGAYWLNKVMLILLPIARFWFRLIRLEKPRHGTRGK